MIYLLCSGFPFDPEFNIEGAFENEAEAIAAGEFIEAETPAVMTWTYDLKIFKTVEEWHDSISGVCGE